ncbi:MAG TPA: lipid-A-disaccharide synthase [Planctomycetia bacterium]|nr:lipid-A-disaccharide synthase [Planctomycetia bacterium]
MRFFLSAGEPSGDLHGSNLISRLRRHAPGSVFTGFGGPKMAAAGCDLAAPLAEKPIIGLSAALKAVPELLGLLRKTVRTWDALRPDAVILIDNPGFNWHVAKAAKKRGIPVVYFVPPQIWSWANWRVNKMRRLVDLVLCNLPFEEEWYRARGVAAARYVGHPFFDDLARRPHDAAFQSELLDDRKRIVALLPGSRGYEVRYNAQTLLQSALKLAPEFPDCKFVVAAFRGDHANYIDEMAMALGVDVDVHVGRTPEILSVATAAIAVSGSVSLELLHYRVPAAVIYRVSGFLYHVARPLLLKSKFTTLVNLIAECELYPEILGASESSDRVVPIVSRWLKDESLRQDLVVELERLSKTFGRPGATDAAAEAVVELIRNRDTVVRAVPA